MTTILEKIEGRPSVALQFMLDGLLDVNNQVDSVIDMQTFGEARSIPNSEERKICFKCAATVTIERLFNHVFTPDEISTPSSRHDAINLNTTEGVYFEHVMDSARRGDLKRLFEFCNIEYTPNLWNLFNDHFFLSTSNWKIQVPVIEKIIENLKKLGY